MQHDVIEFAERFIDSLLASANESDMWAIFYIYIKKKQNETKLILITV
jgi:hypothetical protein